MYFSAKTDHETETEVLGCEKTETEFKIPQPPNTTMDGNGIAVEWQWELVLLSFNLPLALSDYFHHYLQSVEPGSVFVVNQLIYQPAVSQPVSCSWSELGSCPVTD